MEQIFIKVKTMKNRKLSVIDKDIRDCTERERTNYYLSVSKDVIVLMLEKLVKEL